jgi:hypothetical protein
VEESGRTDTATSAGEGTEYVPGLGSALRSLDDNPESPSLASAAAAVITARWRRTDGSAWTPPEQRHAARDTPTGPDPAPRPTSHTARGSAPVPGLARPYPPDNGKGNPYPGAAPGRPPARVEPIPVQRTPGVPVEPPTGPLIAESLVEPAPFATKPPFPPMPPDPGPLDPGLLHPASLDPASLDPTSLDPAPLDPAPLDQASPAPGSSAPLSSAPLSSAPLSSAPLPSAAASAASLSPAAPPPMAPTAHRDRNEQVNIDTDPMLPQRVPAEPDVPDVPLSPNDPLREGTAEPMTDRVELSRIARYLRYDKVDAPMRRREGFDVDAILAAVRTVPDVFDAQLRRNPGHVHTLRIELVDGADPGRVSRKVAQLLREKMGLAAEPNEPMPQSPSGATVDNPISGVARLQRPYVAAAAAQAAAAQAGRAARRDGPNQAGSVERQSGRPLPRPERAGGPGDIARVVIDHVQVTTLGMDATVEVRLAASTGGYAVGESRGPGVDAYLLRLAATAAADAIDQLLVEAGTGTQRGRCLVEYVSVVPFGGCEVAIVVLLLVCGGWAEQLSGSAIVYGDPRQAVVHATLSAVNRRLESLLP